MSNKRRTKKHNPNKRAQRFFSNTRLWSWESMIEEDGTRIAHGEARCGFVWKQLAQKEVNGIVNRNNNWVICCRALCRNPDKDWIETEIISARDVKVNDFADIYEDLRRKVLAAVQLRHVIDVGWIVHSFGKEDRIDDGFELAYPGKISEERQANWAKLNETYHERREQEARAA